MRTLQQIILKRSQFEDTPFAASRDEAMKNDLPTRYEFTLTTDGVSSQKWMLCDKGIEFIIEIVEDDPHAPKAPEVLELEASVRGMPLAELLKWLKHWQRQSKMHFRSTDDKDADSIEKVQKAHDEKCAMAIKFFQSIIRERITPANAHRNAMPKKKQRELGLLTPIQAEGCKHAETFFDPRGWPTGEDLEICKDCGCSRTHWEQGESDWIWVKDIEAARLEIQTTLDQMGKLEPA